MAKTLYNITLGINDHNSIPKDLLQRCSQQYDQLGLLGKKHVNVFGRMFEEHDPQCKVGLSADFDIFHRDYSDHTLRELLNIYKLKASGFDENAMRLQEIGEFACDLIESQDPLAKVAPADMYLQFPIDGFSSLQVITLCGRQSIHAHLPNGEAIQLFKPAKDKFWYDHDALKRYYYNKWADECLDKDTPKGFWENILAIPRRINAERDYQVYKTLVNHPDKIKRVRL